MCQVVEFINYEPGKDPTWQNPVFLLEDEDWNANSYRTLCRGDSGSGQFITNSMESLENPIITCERCSNIDEEDRNLKYILTAVHTLGIISDWYTDQSGKRHTLPCGTNFYRKDLQYLRKKGISHSLAWPEIHRWIVDKYNTM